jgi:autotransporter-associated beta strand protein
MVITGANIFATSITFNQAFNTTNTTSFTNASGATASTLTLGAGNGSTSVSANATAWTLANNATTGNVTFANGASQPLTIKLFTTGNISVLNSGAITAISSNITNWNATITGGITKTGAGTLTLTGTNTYTGSTTINAGNLTISGGNAIVNNGTVILANTAGVNFNVNASETIGTLQGGGATGGTLNIAASQTLTVNQTSDQTFAGVIAGSTGALTKIGANTLTLSGSNTYTGTTTISAGNLTISGGSAIANTGTVTLANTAGVGFNVNSSETIASLQGGGTTGGNVTIASAQTLTVDEAGTQTFAGSLQGSGDFTKSGVGTLTLNGTNTNSGAISVTAGTLTFNGSSALASSVSLLSANSATISLQDGVGRTITISNGGLSLTGSTMVFELGSATDRLTFTTGGATLSGTNTIQLADLGSFTAGNYTLISAASGLNGGTWSLNSINAPTGFTYTLSNSSTTLSLIATANSAFYYWKGGNGSTWGTANNWTSDSAGSTLLAGAPSTTADVVFAATGASNLSNTLGADYTVSTVTLSTGGVTIAGANTLTANTTSALAIRDTASSGTNVISANLAGTGAGLTKSGAGTLTLSGANTFGGGLILSAGTLNLNSDTAPGSGTITISGGTLDNTSGSGVTLSNNNTQSWNGDFTFTGTNTLNLGTGAVSLGASCTVTVSGGTLGVGGIISGSGYSLTKAGAGMLTLRGANTYTGGTTLSAGTLNINSASAIGSGSFTISGGTLNNTSGSSVTLSTNNAQTWNGDFAFTGTNDLNLGNGAVTLGASRTVTVNGGILTVGGIISGSSLGLTKAGAGTLILGGANTYTGATTVSGGTLQTSAADRMSDSSAISVSSGATFALGGNETVASISGAGNYSLGAHTLTFGDTSNQTVSGMISGTGALVKSGSGSITLSSSNSYSGGTKMNAGTIFVGHNSALGSGTLTFAVSGTRLASNDSTDRTISNALGTFAGSSAIYTFGSVGSGNLTFTNTTSAALGGVRTFTVNNSWTSFANAFTGASDGITKAGTGTLILAGNNTYTGATTITAGTLQIGNGGATGSLSTNSAITVNGTLAFNRSDDLTQGTNFSSAAITGTGSLVQNGTGTLTLNAANTYSGGTTLNTGTLVIGNTAAAGTGTITQSSGSSLLKFDTSGTISNNMSIYNVASNQTMTLSGSITAQNTTYDVASGTTLSINGTISGSGGMTKNGTGTLTLTGNNTFTGNTTINSGTLRAGVANALGDTREVMVNSGGSLLIAASEAIDDAAEIELHGGTMKFDGNVTETLGTFSLTANSSIDMGLGSVWLQFANLPALIVTYDLKIYNYTLNTDHFYFASDAFLQNSLSHIKFYSGTDESSFIGSSFIEGLNPFHVRPVPEPETYATAALLLLGLGIYAYRRRQRQETTN